MRPERVEPAPQDRPDPTTNCHGDHSAALRLGYLPEAGGWRSVPWRRALTLLQWTFIWRPL